MISCPQREAERETTLAQFHAIDLSVRVSVQECSPPASWKNRRNAERVFGMARDAGADLLFIEDDIDLASDFPAALAAARGAREVITFFLYRRENHPPTWLEGMTPPVGFYPVPTLHAWAGTQCMLVPHGTVERVLAHPDAGNGQPPPMDVFLKKHGFLAGMRAALPNPVEHRNPVTLVDARRWEKANARGLSTRSLTFSLPRDGSWEGGGSAEGQEP
jgi:hypothetical protein